MESLRTLLGNIDHTVEDNKDGFSISIFKNLILAGMGIDDCVCVKTDKKDMVVSKKGYEIIHDYNTGKRVKPILLAFFACDKYYRTLKSFLENSYNYYRRVNSAWKDSYVYDHIFILEDWRFDLNRIFSSGFKYINEDEFDMGMKFDMIIGNPPYNNGLDLKIHKVLEEHSDRVVFVHPSGFAISHKDGVRKSECKDVDMSKFESIHLFWGNELFNIGLFVPVCVSIWDKNKVGNKMTVVDDAFTKTSYECNCDMVHLHGKMYPKFVKWINENVDFSDNVAKHGGRKVVDKYGFVMSAVRGHPSFDDNGVLNDDFFTVLPEDKKSIIKAMKDMGFDLDEKEKNRSEQRVFSFKTIEERIHFLCYLKSKCVRFILSLSKTSQNLFTGELNQIPWMDFRKKWSDETLRKEWNIDDKMWDYINKFIPDFYSDYHYDGIYTNEK